MLGVACKLPGQAAALGSLWTPARLPLVARFPASGLVTTVDPTQPSQDLTTWTKSPATVTTTSTVVTEGTAGSGNTWQGVYKSISGLFTGHLVQIQVLAKATAGSHTVAAISDNNTVAAYVDLSDGSTSGNLGCNVTVGAPDGNGRRLITVTSTVALGQALICLAVANAKGVWTHVGDGVSSIEFTSIAVQQSNISSISSLGGTAGAVSLTQATPANRPALLWTNGTLYSPVPVAGYVPVMYGDGSNDALRGVFTVGAQPKTVLICAWYANAFAAVDYIYDGAVATEMGLARASGTVISAFGSTNLNWTTTAGDLRVPHAWGAVYNGANGQLYQDGNLRASGNIGGTTATGFTLFANGSGAGNPLAGYIYEACIVNGALSASDMANWYAYCKRAYPGLP